MTSPLGQVQNTEPLLEVENLSKWFGSFQALANISLSIFPGEILGLIGPNGAGKSTLLECLCGLQPVNSGPIYHGKANLPPPSRRQIMFYVPDGIIPYPEHTLEQVLGFFGEVYSLSRDQMEKILLALELAPLKKRAVGSLSKGWRRRLLFAIGMISPHPLLLMDEPFDGLDLHQTRLAMRLLRDMVAEGRTLFLSIHQLTDAEKICDRFVLLSGGRIRGEGTMETLRRKAGITGNNLEEVFLALS
jgi:ABC-type multidrug transport system ATPase subunit